MTIMILYLLLKIMEKLLINKTSYDDMLELVKEEFIERDTIENVKLKYWKELIETFLKSKHRCLYLKQDNESN